MGPHSFKCGKVGVDGTLIKEVLASMGPHSFKCGKFVLIGRKGTFDDGLQWGRTLSSAESHCARAKLPKPYEASMGPHSFKCGKDEND